MKKNYTLVFLFFLSLAGNAQVNYFKGEWTKVNTQDNFTGLLKIEIKDTVVTGEILWTFVAIDSSDAAQVKYYRGLKGHTGIEHVKGVYYPLSHDIHFEGIAKTDPDLIIGMDKYLLKLSLEADMIYGRTLSNGENTGLVSFYKTNADAAGKEFALQKKKLVSRKERI